MASRDVSRATSVRSASRSVARSGRPVSLLQLCLPGGDAGAQLPDLSRLSAVETPSSDSSRRSAGRQPRSSHTVSGSPTTAASASTARCPAAISGLERSQAPVAVPVVDEREQGAANDLIALADLVGQHALFFQQREPRLRPLRVIAGRPFCPVPCPPSVLPAAACASASASFCSSSARYSSTDLRGRVRVGVLSYPLPAGSPGRGRIPARRSVIHHGFHHSDRWISWISECAVMNSRSVTVAPGAGSHSLPSSSETHGRNGRPHAQPSRPVSPDRYVKSLPCHEIVGVFVGCRRGYCRDADYSECS